MKNREQLENDIISAYGSLTEPSWSFVEKRYRAEPYRSVIDQLKQVAHLKDTTDLNEDVSVTLYVSCSGKSSYCLRMSLIGRYTCLSDENGVFLRSEDIAQPGTLNEITDILFSNGLRVLGVEELQQDIAFGQGRSNLYEILFSHDEAI